MPDAKHRDIHARTPDGGVQLASSTDRWHLFDDHVHLARIQLMLLEDACATSSPDYCKQSVVFNAKQCWGFCTTTEKFASSSPVKG